MSGLRGLTLLTIVCALLAWPATGHAQEATISGTVTDSTGGVLPGVTITAVHEASGNTFVAVTDERGAFRMPGAHWRFQSDRRALRIRDARSQGASCSWGRRRSCDSRWRRRPSRSRSPSAASRRSSTPSAPRSAATSIRDRCRSCRSTAATSWTSRCSPSAAARTRRRTSSAASARFS